MSHYKKLYFMGIKGVGMATLAIIAKEAGFIVAGSDVEEEFITDKILKIAGIDVRIGFKKRNPQDFFATSPKNECLFIATAAHGGFDNEEVAFAGSENIKVISHGEAVGIFMEGAIFGKFFEGISVSGSHGKTTIAGMIVACLSRLGLDPSFTVGTSEIFPIGSAGHFGNGKYFVAEADEYLSEAKYDRTPKFLYQKPKYLIINNIDFDHPDFFENIDSVTSAYRDLVLNLGSNATLIVNGDDKKIKDLRFSIIDHRRPNFEPRIITYGADSQNEFIIKNFKEEGFGSRFEVLRENTSLGEFGLSVPGYHNAKNSLAVIVLLIELGVSIQDIQRVLPEFDGVKRRLERVGETSMGVQILDDYAHHPEEIRKSLAAVKSAYPDKKITLVFQAHTFSRTKALFSEFTASFVGVDELIILPTFASARDTNKENIEEDRRFVESIRALQSNVKLIETQSLVVKYIKKNIHNSDKIIITMGAGDVYKIAQNLV